MSYNYSNIAGLSPTTRAAKNVADIVAALAPPPPGSVEMATSASGPKPSIFSSVKDLAPGLIGGVVGYKTWGDHPALGFLAGHALGRNVYPIFKGDTTRALCDLTVEGAGIAGAMHFKKNPIAGWVAGIAAGLAVTALVDGSWAHDAYLKLKAKK